MFRLCLLLFCVGVTRALECGKPVGLEDRTIPDSSMTTSSQINKWHGPSEGRLNNYEGKPGSAGAGCWCANKYDNVVNRYLQVDLGSVKKIGKIATQGRNATWSQYVKKYRITYSKLAPHTTGIFDIFHNEVVYTGNTDKNSIVYNDIPSTGRYIEARYIRVIAHDQEYHGNICMRVEFYECVECGKPVGLEDRTIPDSAMTANSEINKWHGPSEGRLNNYEGKPGSIGVGCWCANKYDNVVNRYLQVDLGSVKKIGKIATQGRNATWSQYVKKYRITYSKLGVIFTGIFDIFYNEVVYPGNTDKNNIVYNDIPSTGRYIEARYIRVIAHDEEYRGNICMRVEFYECVEAVTQPPTVPTTQAPVVCPAGFKLGADGKTCEDVNECTDNTHSCDHYCHNTNGSYVCSCQFGYTLGADKKSCIEPVQQPFHNV
ncbi:lactadherin-like isoform X1 [Oculina patagonica]